MTSPMAEPLLSTLPPLAVVVVTAWLWWRGLFERSTVAAVAFIMYAVIANLAVAQQAWPVALCAAAFAGIYSVCWLIFRRDDDGGHAPRRPQRPRLTTATAIGS